MKTAIKSKNPLNQEEVAIADFLQEKGIEFSVIYSGISSEDDLETDKWEVVFSKGKVKISFCYSTGVGHREVKRFAQPKPKAIKNSIATKQWEDENLCPVFPKSASILYCLLSDAEAVDLCFNEWCFDFCFSDDSIEAFRIYQNCCETYKNLCKIFTRSDIEKMREILQDY